jgi:prepilin-type N-terminal cleavage/methylation domain-containing protein/prepilin-type processing-associated H-X9-DG protein
MKHSRRGFTMVELLVAIGILALLAVLLLAALRFAMASARLSQCMNNLKQVGTALHSFANRNKQWGPAGPPNAFTDGRNGVPVQPVNAVWNARALGSQGGMLRVPAPAPAQTKGSFFFNTGYFWRDRDLTDERVFYCPDMEGTPFVNDASSTTSYESTLKRFTVVDPTTKAPIWTNPELTAMWGNGASGQEVWQTSYDYRSHLWLGEYYVNSVVSYDSGFSDSGLDFSRKSYKPVNLGKQAGESPILSDTIQNPGGIRLGHGNARYNVVYADGHGVVIDDTNRAADLTQLVESWDGTANQRTANTVPIGQQNGWTDIASMRLTGTNYENLELVWQQIFARP